MTADSPRRLPSGVHGRVLDTSALVDLASGRTLYAQAFARHSTVTGLVWAIPTTAVTEAWSRLPDKGRLGLAVLVQLGHSVIEPLGLDQSGPVGEVLEGAEAGADVCAAHVAEVATRRGWPVLTDRGVRLRSIIPGLEIEPLP
ncbi:hypothetical protein [Actinomadura sp. NPDC048394]|uniref:hypothetical protein n=1 Tax=Actinomadura sp. NPDC048394 TaxID=3158223 RepID=UPI0033C11426